LCASVVYIYSSASKADLNTTHGTRNIITVNAQQARTKYNCKDVAGNLVPCCVQLQCMKGYLY